MYLYGDDVIQTEKVVSYLSSILYSEKFSSVIFLHRNFSVEKPVLKIEKRGKNIFIELGAQIADA